MKRNYIKESVKYISESRNYIYFVIGLFFLSSVIGFVFPGAFSFFDPLLAELGDKVKDYGFFGLFWFILQNNATSALLGLFLGVLLGVFPILNSLTNGALIGYVYSKASAIAGYQTIFLLVPHGIFELPAIFISLGLGIKLGMFVFVKKKRFKEFKRRLSKSVIVYLAIVLPLLILAAIIESALIVSGR